MSRVTFPMLVVFMVAHMLVEGHFTYKREVRTGADLEVQQAMIAYVAHQQASLNGTCIAACHWRK